VLKIDNCIITELFPFVSVPGVATELVWFLEMKLLGPHSTPSVDSIVSCSKKIGRKLSSQISLCSPLNWDDTLRTCIMPSFIRTRHNYVHLVLVNQLTFEKCKYVNLQP
jgi:hypothetical protein